MLDDMKARRSSTMMRRSSGRSGVTCDAGDGQAVSTREGNARRGAVNSTEDGRGQNLSGTLLEKLQRFACGTAVRSKRQFAHDFGDLGHMREVARAGLVDVLL